MIKAQPRVLALLDAENLLYDEPATSAHDDYVHAIALASAVAPLTRQAQVAVGVGSGNHTAAFAAKHAWPGCAIRSMRGEDGADRALARFAADLEAVARSFDTVVVGSGDHFFVEQVDNFNRAGLETVVVSWKRKLNRRLQMVAREVRFLDDCITHSAAAENAA